MQSASFLIPGLKVCFIAAIFLIQAGCNTTTYNSVPDYDNMTDEELVDLIETGMKAWRMNGSVESGASCAGCHAPDAFDLAYIRFSDFEVRRRGAIHVGKEPNELNASRLEDIINMIHSLRVKHGITPQDPSEFRPFQPGSKILKESGILGPDEKFGLELRARGLTIINHQIFTIGEAVQSRKELIELDLWHLPIGISLNRWSVDPYSSTQHLTLADWLPVLPVMPKSGKEQQWHSLHDEYLANSSAEQLDRMLHAIDDLAVVPFSGNGAAFSVQKYKAMLIAQHTFRKSVKGLTDGKTVADSRDKNLIGILSNGNPFWEIGRQSHSNNLELPETVQNRYSWFISIGDQLNQIALPWLWLGWMTDITTESVSDHDIDHGILTNALLDADPTYYMHHAFMVAIQIAQDGIINLDIAKILPIDLPAYQEQNRIYVQMLENSLRMGLLLASHDIQNWNKQSIEIELLMKNLVVIENFFSRMNTEVIHENLQLIDKIREKIQE